MTALQMVHRPLQYRLDFASPNAAVYHERTVAIGSLPISLERHYHVRGERIEWAFGAFLPALQADLVDLALSVYVADRVSPRQHHDRNDPYHMQWRRHFHLRVPVREPAFWNQPALYKDLRALLEQFTDDAWAFEFVHRPIDDDMPRQGFLFPMRPVDPVVVPFSGGLDSLAGAVDLVASRPGDTLVSFSAGTNPRTISRQRLLTRALANRFGQRIEPVEVPFGLRAQGHDYPDGEATQRSRGFVFLALAAVVAEQAGANNVAVCENGIGALSLPYNRTQLGTHTTRAVHPLSLIRMSRFVGTVFGRPFRIHNPYLFHTKGEMCIRLAAHGWAALAPTSVSCDTFAAHRDSHGPQCGLCTSCLLRRQSLHAAGLADIDARDGYRYDVIDPGERPTDKQLYPLHAMRDQVEQLRACLRGSMPWLQLTALFPILEEVRHAVAVFEGLDSATIEKDLVRLYRTYVDEWTTFPAIAPLRERAS